MFIRFNWWHVRSLYHEAINAINNAKKYIKSFINDHEIDPIAASTPTPSPTRAKLNIFDFNEMNSLCSRS